MTDGLLPPSRAPAPERCVVGADHPMLAGHFPGHPIVPGAWLLAWVVAAARRRLAAEGEARAIAAVKRAKFLRPLAPDQTFECALKRRVQAAGTEASTNDTVRFTVTSGGTLIAEGSLQLQPLQVA
jgi:3-hydroxymyristoyl/3-hydroxydecanoyl-(acyl carrier protein) dehydratase